MGTLLKSGVVNGDWRSVVIISLYNGKEESTNERIIEVLGC